MPRRKEPVIPDTIVDQLLAGADAATIFDPIGLLDGLKKALAERVLNAEMDHHLADDEPGNRRNGYGKKTVVTDTGQIELEVPRDRQARFDPQLIAKYQRRFPGFDDKIISMYARGMSTREIVGHLRDLYGIEVSPDLISAVTDAVLEEVAAWQARPLEATYPLVFFDALRVKIRDEGLVRNKAVHIALGVRADGAKEILGLWLEQNEGAKFWLRVMNELRNRGVLDMLIAIVDGLKGFPEAINAVFPEAQIQTCWCGRSPYGIARCQDQIVADLWRETARGTDYPNRTRHVKARLPTSWRGYRRAAGAAQEATTHRDDDVLPKSAVGSGGDRSVRGLASPGSLADLVRT
jgi:putative transposase